MALLILLQEGAVSASRTAMRSAAPDEASSAFVPDAPRARLNRAMARAAHAAALLPGPVRDAALAGAERLVRPALAARPYWGDAWLAEAFIAYTRHGPLSAQALRALSRSYSDTPFLRDAALWRTGYGFAVWPRLSPETREHVVREAVWLGHVVPPLRTVLFEAARQSDAYLPLALAWRARSIAGDNASGDTAAP